MTKGSLMGRESEKSSTTTQDDSLDSRSKTINRVTTAKGTKNALNKKHKVRVEAHRGANRLEYENTIKAFGKAAEVGVDGIELDVWLSKDQIPVVIHGSEEDGTFHIGETVRNVQNCTADELALMQLPDGSTIPRLEQVLNLIVALIATTPSLSLNIELKGLDHSLIEKVLLLVNEFDLWDHVIFSSFNYSFRGTLDDGLNKLQISHDISFGYLCWLKEEFPDVNSLIVKPNDILTVDAELLLYKEPGATKELLEKAKAKGLRIGFYFPFAHDEKIEELNQLCEFGADCIIGNDVVSIMNHFGASQPIAVAST